MSYKHSITFTRYHDGQSTAQADIERSINSKGYLNEKGVEF